MPYADVNKKQLYYTFHPAENSTKKAILFIHGLGSSSSFFMSIIPNLASEGHSCLALDTHGSGRSKYSGEDQSTSTIADDALQVLSSLDLSAKDTIIVGHSMGAMVACELAAKNDFAGIVLIGPINPSDQLTQVFSQRIATVEKHGIEALADSIPSAATGSKATGTQKAFIRALILAQSNEGYVSLCKVIANATVPSYKDIKCPVRIIAGEEDKTAPMEGVNLIKEGCRSAALFDVKVLPGVGHWHCIEAAGEVGKLVEEFGRKL